MLDSEGWAQQHVKAARVSMKRMSSLRRSWVFCDELSTKIVSLICATERTAMIVPWHNERTRTGAFVILPADELLSAGGDPGLDHLQKYFFDSLCFFEWTWPFWNPWKTFREKNVWFKQRKTRRKVVPSLTSWRHSALLVRPFSWLAKNRRQGNPCQ